MTLKDWYRARFVDTNEGLARMRVCYHMSVSYHSNVFMCIIKENLIINELKFKKISPNLITTALKEITPEEYGQSRNIPFRRVHQENQVCSGGN